MSLIGIDIGTRTVTLAEVQGARVTKFGSVELHGDWVREGEVIDTSAVGQAIKQLLVDTGVKAKKVWLGIANQRVVVRQVELSAMSKDEQRESLRYQVQDYIPIPVEDAELDIHVLEEYETDAGEQMQRILLVAGHREMINGHVNAARAAGLDPVGVDLNPFAVLRAMGSSEALDTGSQVLVDVGAGVTSIVVHDGQVPAFVRILVMGGDDLTGRIAERLEIPPADAELAKRRAPEPGAHHELDLAISEHLQTFVDEVRSSLDYYQGQPGAKRLSHVVVSGGGALLRGMVPALEDGLRLPVELGDPFRHVPLADSDRPDEELAQIGPLLATAIGLALGGLE